MKRKLIAILGGVLTVMAMAVPQQAMAFGKGEKSVGVSGGYSSYNEGGYISANFQWEFAEHFRLAPDMGVSFENNHRSGFLLNCDMHFPFKIVRGIGLYPLVGLTYNSWHYTHPEADPEYRSTVGANFGAGIDIYFTRFLKMNIQGKYSMMNKCSGAFVGLGFSYVF